jgi:hypothetical protein
MCDTIARVVNTPYTRWTGDDLHGRTMVITPVWVHLDILTMRSPGHQRVVVPDGIDVSIRAKGRLTGWFRSTDGDWFGIVDYELSYADGRHEQVALNDQLVPRAALSPRAE